LIENYTQLDGVAIAEHISNGDLRAADVMETAIELAAALDERLNFIAVECFDIGRQAAARTLPPGRLAGVPYLLKDAFTSWAGTVTTSGCNLFQNYVSPGDAETERRAREAGLLLFAKSTVPEWGWALSTETLLHGDTFNPWDPTRTPGGSSGGSAAAVAAGVVPLASASDGGGSIRVPAAYCGLVGLKPSRGRISLGPQPIDGSGGLAQPGCVSRTVRDQAAFLDIMHGRLPGERDAHAPLQMSFEAALTMPLRRLRIGYTTTSPSHVRTYAAGAQGVMQMVELCARLGHRLEPMSFEGFDLITAYAHARTIYACGHRDVYHAGRALKGSEPCGDDFMRFMFESARSAEAFMAHHYVAAIEGVRLAARQIENLCNSFDLVLTPMTVGPPPKIGHNHMNRTELEDYHATLRDYGMAFSIPFNISGQPACSIPIAVDELGLPVGVQVVGRWGDEATVLALASEIEAASPWRDRHPSLWAGHESKQPGFSQRSAHNLLERRPSREHLTAALSPNSARHKTAHPPAVITRDPECGLRLSPPASASAH
jgi:amidase